MTRFDPSRYTVMKHTRTATSGSVGALLAVMTLVALSGCGSTSSAMTVSASPSISPAASPTPDLAGASTAAAKIIVPIPGATGVWGGCAQVASDFSACPFAPALIARLKDLSSSGYFGDAPPGACGEDYLTASQNGLFVAPQILSTTAQPDGTVAVIIDRGSPQPKFTVTMSLENGLWLATDLASGAGPSASIFSAKPNC